MRAALLDKEKGEEEKVVVVVVDAGFLACCHPLVSDNTNGLWG